MTTTTKKPVKTLDKTTASIHQRLLWIANTIFHQLVAIVGVFILWTLCYHFENRLSKWHMILLTIAYIPVMAEAIVLFANDNLWTQYIPRKTKYYIHGSFLFTSAILATVGIGFMIYSHSSPHFTSTHGWLGLVSWIFVLLSQFLGVCSAKAQALKFIMRPVYFKFIHNLFGLLGYLFGLASLCYGLEKRSIKNYTSEESRTGAVVVIALIAAWSLIAALKSGINQLRTILS